MIELATDFECGNGKAIERLGTHHFKFQVRADQSVNYGSYFCFDLINDGDAAEVTVEVWEDASFGAPTSFPRAFPTTIWYKPIADTRYRPLRDQLPECKSDHITLKIPVAENQHIRVGITYAAPYSEAVASLTGYAKNRSDRCSVFSLGKSVEGRELTGLKAGTEGKPKVFCVAGQHTHEHSAIWGTLGIADYISSALPEAEALREELEVYVLPVTNPDGNVNGLTFNTEGLDLYRAFVDNPDAEDPVPHESRLLWNWIRQSRPALWMNFHAYTGWQSNSEYPYHGWYEVPDRDIISDPAQRQLYDAICDTLRLKTDAASSHGKASIHRPDSLCYQMTRRFGIPHVFYELNNGTGGKHRAAQDTLHIFNAAVQTLTAFR